MQVLFADLYSPYIPIPEGRGFTALFGKCNPLLKIVPQTEDIFEREKFHIQKCYKENPKKSLNIMCTANIEENEGDS